MIGLAGSTLTSLGWFVVRTSGLEDKATRGLVTTALEGRETHVVTSPYRVAEPRNGVLTLGLMASAESALITAQNTLDAVINRRGGIVLTSTRRPNQQLTVYALGGPVTYGNGPEFVAPFYLELGLRVQAVDPWWEDSSAQSVAFTTSAIAMPQGTADAYPVITISASGGTVNNPVLTYKSGSGGTLLTLSPTVSILNGDAWQIDSQTNQVRKRVSGTWSNALDTLPAVFDFPVFRGEHFTYGTNSPTLEVTGGNGLAAYRRKWA